MGLKLSELEVGSRIILQISNDENHIAMDAVIKKPLKDNVALITLVTDMKRRLVFDGVQIDVEYTTEDGIPYVWRDTQIVFVKNEYILQVRGDGVRHNRRGCFRVPVACYARMRCPDGKGTDVMVRDISLSGFSLADRDGELNIHIGEFVEIYFEDLGHVLQLKGKAVRMEEQENRVIYGFQIMNLCKDLSSYVTVKQRHRRNG